MLQPATKNKNSIITLGFFEANMIEHIEEHKLTTKRTQARHTQDNYTTESWVVRSDSDTNEKNKYYSTTNLTFIILDYEQLI